MLLCKYSSFSCTHRVTLPHPSRQSHPVHIFHYVPGTRPTYFDISLLHGPDLSPLRYLQTKILLRTPDTDKDRKDGLGNLVAV